MNKTNKKTAVKTKPRSKTKIPPPPGAEASWEEQAAYFEKYDWDDLRKAGYLRPLTKKEQAEHDQFVDALRRRRATRRKKVS